MNYIKNTIILSLLTIFIPVCYADSSDNIYTWRSGNGTVTFSQSAPMFDQEYEKVGVHLKNEVHQKSPVEEQLNSIKQNNLHKDEKTQQDQNTQQQNEDEIVRVKIISPARGENRFIHNEKLSIILEPTLTANDYPIFIMNGIPHPALFQTGAWKINRPNPGPASIIVRGRTHDHKTITSNESEFYRRSVMGR